MRCKKVEFILKQRDRFYKRVSTTIICKQYQLACETLQNAFPQTFIVKSLSTMPHAVMVNPGMLSEDSTVFVSGNDETEANRKDNFETIWLERLRNFGFGKYINCKRHRKFSTYMVQDFWGIKNRRL